VIGEETAIETLKLGATDYVLKGRLARLVPAVHRAMREVREEELAVENKKARGLLDKEVLILTKAMDATTDGIFLIEAMKPDFPLTYVNSTYQKIIGHDKKDILGKNYFSLTSLHFDQHIVEEIKSTLLQGKSFHDELLSFKKDDVQHCYSLRITPVHDGSGAITNYIGIKTDVTLIRDKNLEIKEQRENLLHVTRVGKLAEFVSSLAHEISQPLTAILAYVQTLERLLKNSSPQVIEILQCVIKDNKRAAEVIRRLRSLLKKGKSIFESIDINALINETVALITTDAIVRNKAIKIQLAKDLPRVHGDRIQLQQVILNLISNSLEAMESIKDAHELLIRTSLKDSDTILIEVKDLGCGIPKQDLDKLFVHFFTTKPDGLGMGLSISRSIIETHGGLLDAKNNPDGGAIFYFTLPVGGGKDIL